MSAEPPFLALARDAREVLLEHALPLLADGDIAELFGSHRVLADVARDTWRKRLAELLRTCGEDEGLLQTIGEKTTAGWKRAYRNCSVSSRLFEGSVVLEESELPLSSSPEIFDVDNESFFVETRKGGKLMDAFSGKCIQTFLSAGIFAGHPLPLKIIHPLDRRKCLASTENRDGLSLWDMVEYKLLHTFEASGPSGIIKLKQKRFGLCRSNPDRSRTIDIWSFAGSITCVLTITLEPVWWRVKCLSDSLVYSTSHSYVLPGRIALWDVNDGKCVFDVCVSQQEWGDTSLVSCCGGNERLVSFHVNKVNIWCIKTQTCIESFGLGLSASGYGTIGMFNGSLCAAVDFRQNSVKVLSTKDGSVAHENEVDTPSGVYNCKELTKLTSVSYVTGWDRDIQVWKLPMPLIHQNCY